MSIPEIDRLTEVVVLLKRKRPVTYEDIEWLVEEIVRLRETILGTALLSGSDVSGEDT